MRKLAIAATCFLTAIFVAGLVSAQSVGLGIKKTAPLSGTGSSGSPLKIDVCLNGSAYVSNGTSWACSAEVGDISSVGATASMGLTGGATSGAALLGLLSTCADGEVLKSGGTGTTWTCAADTGGSSYTAGDGLTLTALDFDLTYTSDFAITTDQLDLSTAVTAPGTLAVAGIASLNATVNKLSAAGGIYIKDNTIGTGFDDAGSSTMYINYYGYNGTTGTYRTLTIADGDAATIATFAGSTKATTLAGSLSTAGNLTAGDATTDVNVVNGSLAVTGAAGTVFTTNNNNTLGDSSGDSTTVNGNISVTHEAYFGSTSQLYLTFNELYAMNFGYSDNSVVGGRVNAVGYQGGTTQFRNFDIEDGKGADIATFTGSTKAVALAGALTIAGHTTAGDTTSDNTTINGHLGIVGTAPTLDGTCGAAGTISGADNAFHVVPNDDLTCTATFSRTFTNAPVCVITLYGTGTIAIDTLTATALTWTATAAPAMDVICIGNTL